MADNTKVNDILVFFLVSHFFCFSNCENLKRLIPEQIVLNEQLYHNQSRIYLLTILENEHHYELRISYPATIPTEFLIKLTSSLDNLSIHDGRKLLNIEKVIFESDKHDQYAIVTAIRTGLPRDLERLKDPVYYNIVLEKLYLGLPWEVWKTGMLILCALTIVLTLILPKIQDFFEKENLKSTKTM